ncbi:uncharacterized protein METZ01_LOCUS196710, partial [marine metagenome]
VDVKRMLTLVFGLALVSVVVKHLAWQMNPSTRLYRVGYDYSYSTGNYIQFFIMLMIPSVAAFFLYRSSFKRVDNFYDRVVEVAKEIFLVLDKNKESVLVIAIAVFWVFSLMEHGFFRNLVEDKNPFHAPFDAYH